MALEGGRQSGHLWQQANTDFLKSYGFTQFWGEPCIFTLKRDGSFLLATDWIDDLAIAHANKDDTSIIIFQQPTGSASEAISPLVSTSSMVSKSRAIATHARSRYLKSSTSRRQSC
eukprot:6208248-Pleurochrysis_carterae.AAC.2